MKICTIVFALVLNLLLSMSTAAVDPAGHTASTTHAIEVYHDPGCSCCHRWIEHLEENGFTVIDRQTRQLNLLKQELKIPPQLASCHTATIGGYIIEGHVPAADIKQLLTRRPDSRGLSVPGMPIGSPGMEMGQRRDAYAVIEISDKKESTVFKQYPAKK